ncbi:hypothetical protein PENTCL1PPCAC_14356 [Pristionchus entomophagus]|uniref:Gut esterase 1 n=1 Tax=Pristionchus entomophagus TaxID=358040 RepID=A0AAV5TGJ4_9BILA|nr:hypothetical protein PENTCL1PPCAC_14356 [Pristionchus entomophagus]
MLCLAILFLPTVAFSTVVKTPFGELEGFDHITDKGVPTHVFLGVRYGQEPGRFEKPEMVGKWAPARKLATSYGSTCYPYTEPFIKWLHGENTSEDCLFMNIITPKILGSADLPVFVFIHGGGYAIGASDHYGYKRLAERVASEGIVVVTINYRLGPFGFFSLGDSVAPGNMGLWDATLALLFMHEILPSFGADIDRITVAGHSAGSCLASALQFSPHANALFSQSMLLSGSTVTEFGLAETVVDESRKIAKELGCLSESTTETFECMQKVTPLEIIRAVEKVGVKRYHPHFLIYHPRLDGDFFPQSIEKLAESAPQKRSLSGATEVESALFVFHAELDSSFAVKKSDYVSFSRSDLVEYLETVIVPASEQGASASALRRLLVEFYVERDEKKDDYVFYLQRYTDLISDLQFLIPTYLEIQIKTANNWPTYLYIMQHATKNSPRDEFPVKGAFHGDELNHFSDNTGIYPIKENDSEFEATGLNFATALVNFVKNGDPSSPPVSWSPMSKAHPFQHASMSANMSFKQDTYRAEAARFWLGTVPKSIPMNLLRRAGLPVAEGRLKHTEL